MNEDKKDNLMKMGGRNMKVFKYYPLFLSICFKYVL